MAKRAAFTITGFKGIFESASIIAGLCVLCLLMFSHTAALAAEPPIKIGLMAAMSGEVASVGQDCRAGYELAARNLTPAGQVKGRRIEYIYADHQGDGRVAVSEFKKLVEVDKVLALVTHHSQPTMQINPLSHAKGVPLFGALAQDSFLELNNYAYRFWPSARHEAAHLANALRDLKIKSVAMVSVQDEYTLSLRNSLRELLNQTSIRILIDQEVTRHDTNLSTLAARVKASGAEAVFINLALQQLAPFARRLREMSVQSRIFANVWLMASAVREDARDGSLDGSLFAQLDPGPAALGGADPQALVPPVTYACYAAVAALIQGLETARAPLSRERIRESLERLSHIEMPGSKLAFENREAIFPLKLKSFFHSGSIDYVPKS